MNLFEHLLRKRDHHHRNKHSHYDYRQHDDYAAPNRHPGWGDRHAPRHGSPGTYLNPLLQQLLQNKTLLIALVMLVVVLLVAAVVALIYLLPVILKMFGYVGENGIKGLLEQVTVLLNQLWLGSGKQQ